MTPQESYIKTLEQQLTDCKKQVTLLREALKGVLKAHRSTNRPPNTVMQAELQLDTIRAAVAAAQAALAATEPKEQWK